MAVRKDLNMPNGQPLDSAALTALQAMGPGALRTRAIDLAEMAHDASHYLLQPRAVIQARDTPHVAELFRVATEHQLPITFRSGGTSLSGQAGTEHLLVETRRNFRGIEVLDRGARVRTQPGATLRSVNACLATHWTKLGPDPASEGACTIGGVIANNSSGMECGTALNSYRTVESMTFVLPSGTTIDTAQPNADHRLLEAEPALWRGLAELRDRLRGNPDSLARIRHQFSMKNTMGYSLNAFLDYDAPVDILSHLMIGSEGTLGFVADATFRTVPILAHAATALLVFDTLSEATAALPELVGAGARTVELMDSASIRAIQKHPRANATLATLNVREHTALLIELQATSMENLANEQASAQHVLNTLRLATPANFTSDAGERAALWHLRKGLYTAVAGARPTGTTALLEDIVVPTDVLTTSTERLKTLLSEYGYHDAVIFGHAKDANLHFMITPRFDEREEFDRYQRFTEDLVDLVLSVNGSLKAEHGTGRMMAPYVRRQYGEELYDVMRSLKRLCDPAGVLNPGVILNEDSRVHLQHLKTQLPVHPSLDTCVECGYCEPVCPSQDVTTTPRQRIVILREIAAADAAGDTHRAAELRDDFGYEGVDTCAADSMCSTACPVNIDTGAVMKEFRRDRHGRAAQRAGVLAAEHWAGATSLLRAGLRAADSLPPHLLENTSRRARSLLPHEWVPMVEADLPAAGPRRPSAGRQPSGVRAVHFPACVGSLFGPVPAPNGEAGLGATAALERLCERAGIALALPTGMNGLCCGTPWKSKGFDTGYAAMAQRTFEALWLATDEGQLPVVADAASCTLGLREIGPYLSREAAERYHRIRFVDAVTFVRTEVLPRTVLHRRFGLMVLHPTCSGTHLGSTGDLEILASHCAERVVVPSSWRCCGFAGDRGLIHPEVTAAATALEAAELAEISARTEDVADAYASDNRTCEMGMSRATGKAYRHILELLEYCTR